MAPVCFWVRSSLRVNDSLVATFVDSGDMLLFNFGEYDWLSLKKLSLEAANIVR